MAAEVGIEPRHVAAAARELEAMTEAEAPAPLGAPTVWEMERVFAGEVSEEDWQEMVAAIRRTFGHPGTPGALGTAREWHGDSGYTQVTVTPRGGQTRIQVTLRNGEPLLITYLVAGVTHSGTNPAPLGA